MTNPGPILALGYIRRSKESGPRTVVCAWSDDCSSQVKTAKVAVSPLRPVSPPAYDWVLWMNLQYPWRVYFGEPALAPTRPAGSPSFTGGVSPP